MKYAIPFFISLSISYANAQNTVQSWGVDNTDYQVRVQDASLSPGDESLYLHWNGIMRNMFISAISPTTYSANYVKLDDDRNYVEDLNIDVSTGSSFTQIKTLLRRISFRSSFVEVPTRCPSSATAFLIINDNLKMLQYGYCLIPSN